MSHLLYWYIFVTIQYLHLVDTIITVFYNFKGPYKGALVKQSCQPRTFLTSLSPNHLSNRNLEPLFTHVTLCKTDQDRIPTPYGMLRSKAMLAVSQVWSDSVTCVALSHYQLLSVCNSIPNMSEGTAYTTHRCSRRLPLWRKSQSHQQPKRTNLKELNAPEVITNCLSHSRNHPGPKDRE